MKEPTLDVQRRVDPSTWDSTIRRLGSNVFHSNEWAAFTSFAQPNATPHYFALNSAHGVACAALGFVSQSRFNILRRLWFDALPALVDHSDELSSEFLIMVHDWARKNGIHVCTIGSYGYERGMESLVRFACDLERRFEFSIPLVDRSIDDIWRGMDKRRRNNVKAAQSKGVTAEERSSDEGLETLRLLQVESSERIVQRGGQGTARSYRRGEDPFSVLIKRGAARLFVAKVGDRPLSARLCSMYNGLVYCISGGHAHEGLKYNTGTLLHWELIRRFKDEGVREYNLGGSKFEAQNEDSPEHGVYVYKKQFGAECRECANGTKILRPIAYSFIKPFMRYIG